MAIVKSSRQEIEEEHKAYHRRLFYVFIMIVLFLFGGMFVYHHIEGWRYIDSLYFSAATMTTVGYGDITPQTDLGKLLTVIYVFTGVGMALYGLSLITSHLVEVREEFWLEKFGRMKINARTNTFWAKIKSLWGYNPGKIIKSYEKAGNLKNKK